MNKYIVYTKSFNKPFEISTADTYPSIDFSEDPVSKKSLVKVGDGRVSVDEFIAAFLVKE